jgi:integrase
MTQFRLFKGKSGCYFVENVTNGKQSSLRTRNATEAQRLLFAKNEAHREPIICLQIARSYLTAADPVMKDRTWQMVMDQILEVKRGSTKLRWVTACKDHGFDLIRKLKLVETHAEDFWKVLKVGTVSTNTYLRRLHNFAIDMNWILAPVIPRRQWPKIHFKDKRAITLEEHRRIVQREKNPERKLYYELAWHLGASQSDLANLHAEDIDWSGHTITFERMKLSHLSVVPPQIRFGGEVKVILNQLPRTGPLFPYLCTVREADRATEFKQRCLGLDIHGVTLHSYRYAWAERAMTCGYPERFAQKALGHNSKAVHRAYARKAQVTVPALEDYEKEFATSKVVAFPLPTDHQINPLAREATT